MKKLKKRSKVELEYKGPIFRREWINQLQNQRIDYENTPFSLGYNIYFLSNSHHVSDNVRLSLKNLKKHVGQSFKGQGYASSYAQHKVYCISIIDEREDMDIIRFIEVLTHEASHIVDYIIENCVISNIDTEVRAYVLDHIVGLCLRKLKIAELEGFYKGNKLIKKGK